MNGNSIRPSRASAASTCLAIWRFAALLAGFVFGPAADAATIPITSEAAFPAHGVVDWSAYPTTLALHDETLTTPVSGIPGLNATLQKIPDSSFLRIDSGADFGQFRGAFSPNEALMRTTGAQPSVVHLSFDQAISGFGLQVQRSTFGIFDFEMRAFDVHNNLLGGLATVGNSHGNLDDSAPFVGLVSPLRDIARVELQISTGAQRNFYFNSPLVQVPEPAAICQVAIAVVALGCFALVRRMGPRRRA